MSKELWYKINNFQFDDQSGGEYTFTVRLAKENYWTRNFTERAIEEYKKFMYLAAITDQIVSPSETIDVVWHQHLVYTKLYNDFSTLVGKQIQHIPSTHNKEDFNRFKQARERTKLLYDKIFGKQPADIWTTREMYDSLNLQKSKLKIRTFLVWGLVFNLVMLLPCYYFLKPILCQMSNFYFFTLLISATVLTIILLINLNSMMIGKILSKADKNSFIFNLHPSELIYSRRKKPEDIINSYLDFCIRKNAVIVTASNKLQASEHAPQDSADLFGIINKLKSTGPLSYNEFLKVMTKGSAIFNVSNCMDAFVKYIGKSKNFGAVFYINYFFYSLLFLFGFTRLMTGFFRDKPVLLISVAMIILLLVILVLLISLTEFSVLKALRKLYIDSVIPKTKTHNQEEWRYCMDTSETFTPQLNKLIQLTQEVANRKGRNSGFFSNLFYTNSTGNGIFSVDNSSGDSDGSDSSCGSSCGGCGGD